jgi:class 3 adenylate cyclase/tetratricopeptide (TPR) repeat protein
MSVASQTLTFLFSDLRDYTRFVEQFGDTAATTLIGDYRRIVRAEVAKTAGAEIKTEGDSFYVVFTSARAAVSCGVGILREAERYSRARSDRAMKVGVGIHAGEPTPHEGQYVGAAVIVAARLAQVSAAGELLVSEVVRALLPKNGFAMARHEAVLKGIERPPAIFRVDWQQGGDRPALSEQPAISIEAPAPTDRRILCPTLIGRDVEIGRLVELLEAASGGSGRTALIGADAGLGKSALLREFLGRARERGARVLFGECSEIEARRPFGPVIDAFAATGMALPEVLRVGGPGAQSVSELERYRAHAGLADALASAARSQPLVLAIDDVHWADEATLELVPYLARKLRSARVLVVAAYRTDELHRTHPLNHVLAELSRGRLVDDITLRPLTEDETAALISGALGLGRAPTSAFRRAIHERCEGSPFFVEEVLRALVGRGDLEYRDGAWRRAKEVADLVIPVSVREAVQERLRALTPAALRTVQVAAVIGQRFDFDLLQKVSGREEAAVLEALRTAVDEQIIDEEPGKEEAFRFRHALTRETVLADLLQRERRLLHRTIAETIERSSPDPEGRAEDLAYHFDEARDNARAYRYHEAAARASLSLLAFARALHHLERAVELAPDDDPALGPLLLRLSDVASENNELDRARRAAEEALRIFERSGDARGQGASHRRLARLAWFFEGSEQAMEHARRSVALLEPDGPSSDLAAAYAEVARQQMLAYRTADAIATADQAIATARAAGDAGVELEAAITEAIARGHDDPETAIVTLRTIARTAEEKALVKVALRAHQNVVSTSIRAGSPLQEMWALHQDGMRYMHRHGIESEDAISRETFLRLARGEWDEMLRWTELHESTTFWGKMNEICASIALLAREGPDPHLRRIDDLSAQMIASGDRNYQAHGQCSSAIAHHLVGDPEGALERLAPLRESFEAISAWEIHPAGIIALRSAVLVGNARAERDWRRWLSSARSAGLHRQMREALGRAYDALTRGEVDTALKGLDEVGQLGEVVLGGFLAASAVRRWAAELHLARADHAGAKAEIDALVPFWRKVRATWYMGRIAEWARERGLTVTV